MEIGLHNRESGIGIDFSWRLKLEGLDIANHPLRAGRGLYRLNANGKARRWVSPTLDSSIEAAGKASRSTPKTPLLG